MNTEKKENHFGSIWEQRRKAGELLGRIRADREAHASLVAFQAITNPNAKWRYLSNIGELFFIFSYAEFSKEFTAMSIDFSDDFEDKVKLADDKYGFIRRRLNGNFKNILGFIPEYMFILEKSKKYHIHGIIKVPPKYEDKFKRVIKITVFGKDYKDSPKSRYIVDFRPLYHALGWLGYCLKKRNLKTFKTKYYATDELKRKTKSYFGL